MPDRDQFLESLAEGLQTPVDLSSLTTARIMSAVRADAARRRRRVRAVLSLAAAAVIVIAVAGVITVQKKEGTAVQFVLPVEAREVAVVGDFNHWDTHATPLTRTPNGTWRATVRLTPGAHVYSFVVDGTRWVPDPAAPLAPGTDFGAPNSLVTVAPGTT